MRGKPDAQQPMPPAAGGTGGRHRRASWLGVLVPTATLALSGLLGGVLWAWWAEPVTYTVTPRATFLDEEQLGRLFGVEARYAVVGLVGGFVVSAVLSVGLRRTGWPLAVGMVLGGAAAAALSYLVGVALGPAPVQPGTVSPADTLAVPFEVRTHGFFLVWAVGAMAGLVLAATARDRRDRQRRDLGLPDLVRR